MKNLTVAVLMFTSYAYGMTIISILKAYNLSNRIAFWFGIPMGIAMFIVLNKKNKGA